MTEDFVPAKPRNIAAEMKELDRDLRRADVNHAVAVISGWVIIPAVIGFVIWLLVAFG